MAPKHHPVPLSGGDRKALAKELGRARAMTTILATRSAEARTKGEALFRTADTLLCESWNERVWADGQPIDPSPSIDQAINGGYGPCGCRPHPARLHGLRSAAVQQGRKSERNSLCIGAIRKRVVRGGSYTHYRRNDLSFATPFAMVSATRALR
jgi:hypothetical protein